MVKAKQTEVTLTLPIKIANMAVQALYDAARQEAGQTVAPFLCEAEDLEEWKAAEYILHAMAQES